MQKCIKLQRMLIHKKMLPYQGSLLRVYIKEGSISRLFIEAYRGSMNYGVVLREIKYLVEAFIEQKN